MPKFTIIVPTYNMSHYLDCCINSLKKQTYKDFEVILVDDCSTDDSYSKCLKTTKEDLRFRVVQQKRNSGLSATRNLGIVNARGKYLLFVDPDDYVENDLLEMVNNAITTDNVDIVTWGMYANVIYSDGHEEIKQMSVNSNEDHIVIKPNKADWEFFIQKLFFASTCNKVYKFDTIKKNNLQFDTECVDFEDLIFNATYIRFIKSYSVKQKAYYHYRQKIGQKATIKRSWGKVTPFAVSDKVYNACEILYNHLKNISCEYDNLMLYAFKSFMNEIEYNFRTKTFREFINIVSVLPKNSSYYKMLTYMNQPEIRKLILLLRVLTKMNLGRIQASLLWLSNKKNQR